MRFKDITENNIESFAEKHGMDMFHKIYQNCQPFLQEISNQPDKFTLSRGISYIDHTEENPHYDVMGIKNVRLTGRRPMDTAQSDHDDINEYFDQNYGHPFRNGLFVTGTTSVAGSYGNVFAIFPIGKYDYIWHPQITDLYSEIIQDEAGSDHWREYAADKYGVAEMESWETPQWDEFQNQHSVEDLLSWYTEIKVGRYRTDGLKSAINSARTEIMIWVEQYYYIHPSYLKMFQDWLSK